MLQLKKQQLQGVIAGIAAKADALTEKEKSARAALDSWVGLFAADGEVPSNLVKVVSVQTGTANVAGVQIPVFEGIETEMGSLDLWATPAWLDDAAKALRNILSLRKERDVLLRQRDLIAEELRSTSQRVNLFEKVKIPECRENIRVIKIAIGDEQTAAVTRGKIAKSRGTGEEDAA